jgi:Putative lactococcus lactis phage r1t holin
MANFYCFVIKFKEEGTMNLEFVKDTAERAGRTFVQGYLSFWLVNGADFDGLVSVDSLKAGAVALALSVAMSMGLKKVGPNKNSGSVV